MAILTNQSWHDELHLKIETKALKLMIKEKVGHLKEYSSPRFNTPPETDVDLSHLEKLQGWYSFLARSYDLRVRKGKLILKIGNEEFRLKSHGKNTFSTPRGHYIEFLLDDRDQPRLMTMITPGGYFLDLDYVDPLVIDHGPDKQEWKQYIGLYRLETYDMQPYAAIWVRNGHLYMRYCSVNCLLEEHEPGLFFTRDGEVVTFGENHLLIGNEKYRKVSDIVKKIRYLARVEPENRILANKTLKSLELTLLYSERKSEAEEISEISRKLYAKKRIASH
ncbi:MAG: hypothetical protein ACFFD4_37845 [Candidatus Odinarchaeota archaeon]